MSFQDRIAAALDVDRAQDAGTRVHEVVIKELKSLDPSVDVVATNYFNHSYVPDVVVQWKESGRAHERPVFLRHSLRSSRASGDLEDVSRSDTTALYLSLAPEEPEEDTRAARRVIPSVTASRALVTTAPAIDELSQPSDGPDPVLGIVRSSVVRSARGFVVEDDVEKLILPKDRQITDDDLAAFTRTVESSFTEEAALRINRVFGIVEQAVSPTPDDPERFASGELTPTEMRELVPYLLGLEGVTQSRDFWVGIARMITLEEIERLWPAFDGLDLTPLASAASGIWRAKRAQLSLRSESIDDEDFDATPRWTVVGRLLAAEVGNWRVGFAYTPTKLKASGRDGVPARWDDLKPNLHTYRVAGAELSGVVTRSNYGLAEGAEADMTQRIENFIASADDSFHVPAVTVVSGVGEDAAVIKADFAEMLLEAKPNASIGTMAEVAINVLGYRYSTDLADVDLLLGRESEQEEGESAGEVEE